MLKSVGPVNVYPSTRTCRDISGGEGGGGGRGGRYFRKLVMVVVNLLKRDTSEYLITPSTVKARK